MGKNENWERFLPKFEHKNLSKRKQPPHLSRLLNLFQRWIKNLRLENTFLKNKREEQRNLQKRGRNNQKQITRDTRKERKASNLQVRIKKLKPKAPVMMLMLLS